MAARIKRRLAIRKEAMRVAEILRDYGRDADNASRDDCSGGPVSQMRLSLSAVKVSGEETMDASLMRAFNEFELDPADPLDWHQIAVDMAAVLFPKPKKSGAPAKWDTDLYSKLLQAVDRVRHSKPELKSVKAWTQIVSRTSRTQFFREAGPEALRNAYYRACNPAHNDELRDLIEDIVEVAKRHTIASGRSWDDTTEQAVRRWAPDFAISEISSRWQRLGKT
jgi:hypothetical protein